MIARLYDWLTREPYEYGYVCIITELRTGQRARRHRYTGEVQFVLWHAGEQCHTTDYWYPMGDGWANYFIPDVDTPD
jgi:hypothetical protein